MKYSIGIDLGGTNIKYALVAKDGEIIYSSKAPTQADKSKEVVIENISKCCQELLEYAKNKNIDVIGIGLASPGVIDDGIVLGGAENLPDWENLPLGDIIGKQFEKPIFIYNDANMMGLAEVRFGDVPDIKDAVFLTVGTGIGGAMVLNGQLYGGHRNRGAELGHITINSEGTKCSCGSIGCLEEHASVAALIRYYKELLGEEKVNSLPEINGEYIVQRFHEKENEAIKAFDIHFNYLSMGIAGFINIFSPQKVIIGGGISEAGSFYIENIRERVAKFVMKETSVFTQIDVAKLGNSAGLMGAAAIVFDNME